MGPAAAFVLTDDEVAALGQGAKTFPVVVRVNGSEHRLRLARMKGQNLIGLNKQVRAQAGLELGSDVDVEITRDTAQRTVEVPEDLQHALAANPEAQRAFTDLAYSHRKEYVRWIIEAKREATRATRIEKTVLRLTDNDD